MLKVVGLRKSYGPQVALNGVDLHVAPGEVVGLLGPNGAGKTTLVSIIAGLRRADAGSVEVGGIDALAHPHRARGLIGIAPQDTGIYPIVTVRQNLAVFAELAGLWGREVALEVERVAAGVQIEDLLDRKAGELSGGQKRRLHTAIALLGRPPLILLDEATTGADVATRAALIGLMRSLAEAGSAVLYSTHYLQEVETLGASVAMLEQGRVIARGPVRELIASHGRPVVELSFSEPPLELPPGLPYQSDSNVVRFETPNPTADLARLLSAMSSNGGPTPTSVEVISPSLETVYLALTGARYREDEGSDLVSAT